MSSDISKKHILELKPEVSPEDLTMVSATLLPIIFFYMEYAFKNNLPARITSLVGDYKGARVSLSHREKRAADLSVRGWPEVHIHKMVFEANQKFKSVAAISASDRMPRAMIYHKGSSGASHIHSQVKYYMPQSEIASLQP